MTVKCVRGVVWLVVVLVVVETGSCTCSVNGKCHPVDVVAAVSAPRVLAVVSEPEIPAVTPDTDDGGCCLNGVPRIVVLSSSACWSLCFAWSFGTVWFTVLPGLCVVCVCSFVFSLPASRQLLPRR